MLTLPAPAKINLTLEVIGKRPDGYHEIRSIIQTINLCDELQFQSSCNSEYVSDLPAWNGEKSLITKVADLLRNTTGTSKGIHLFVKKRIPLVSGLGGDSSDAAAALRGLNELWGLGLGENDLLDLAARLGSDVPFFVYGGTALMEGRGEIITPLPPVHPLWIALMVPDIPRPPNKTAQLYNTLHHNHYTDGKITEQVIKSITEDRTLYPEQLFNTFENIAFNISPELAVYRSHILKIGASNLHLAGSGPTLFSVIRDKTDGEELKKRLEGQGMKVLVVETMAINR
jgi:4-diphosphocytidyl-2-C-methyl-D-erythritol kinase